MKKMKIIFLYCVFSGCSVADIKKSDAPNVLSMHSKISFSSYLFENGPRIVSYSKRFDTLSVIDADALKPVYQRKVSSKYNGVLALPGSDGALLFSKTQFLISAPEGEEIYKHDIGNIGWYDLAVQVPAYVFAGMNGDDFFILRNKSPGSWQAESLGEPWGDAAEATANELVPPALFADLSDDGSKMLLFRSYSGQYATYEAATANSDMNLATACPGDATGDPATEKFRSMIYAPDLGVAIVGDKEGQLFYFNPISCIDIASWNTLSLPDAAPIQAIQYFGGSVFAALQSGGKMTLLTFAANTLTITSKFEVCQHPYAASKLVGGQYSVGCVEPALKSPASINETPLLFQYSQILVETYAPNKSKLSTFSLDGDVVSGNAIDVEASKVYVVRDSSVGRIDVSNLLTGETITSKGYGLDGIFND